MTPADVPGADLAAWAALRSAFPPEFIPDEAVRVPRAQARVAHLQRTDPDGAWVAEDSDGRIIGTALSLVREGIWGLSLLGVDPDHHARGIGGELLRASARTLQDARGGIILSSTHPAAMRSYFRLGFDLRPCVALAGALKPDCAPAGLQARPGTWDDPTLARAARHVRTAAYGEDVKVAVEQQGCALLLIEDRGFVVHREGSPVLLCALDEDTGRDLLWSAFAAATRGGSVHVDFVMAGHDWIIDVGLQAGLELSPEGPVFTRGDVGPFAPFLPSGAYL